MGTRTSIYTNELMGRHLHDLVPKLGGLAPAITIVLDRYQELMRLGRSALRTRGLTEDEQFALENLSLSTIFEPAGIIAGALEADVEDADPEELGAADQTVLLAKLQALSALEQFALVDMLEGERAKI